MEKFKRILTVARVLDFEGNVSLTNVLMIMVVISGVLTNLNPIVFVTALVLYGFSRFLNYKRGQAVQGAMRTLLENQKIQAQQLRELKDQVTGISMKAGILTNPHIGETVTKLRRF